MASNFKLGEDDPAVFGIGNSIVSCPADIVSDSYHPVEEIAYRTRSRRPREAKIGPRFAGFGTGWYESLARLCCPSAAEGGRNLSGGTILITRVGCALAAAFHALAIRPQLDARTRSLRRAPFRSLTAARDGIRRVVLQKRIEA
jgi:hypothetical protein